ncbi:malate dehydrogenase [Alphaproteobacteria bacterium]|jgi:malate dehydrogenase|nr:malate dehydrogenase [Alphaproteobacteria bacterium]|tara:strand:- start:3143 stop:4087 length:945 start_codon:yes stop_codon:yes gene_type:complete
MAKISLIGAGNIGGTLAHLAAIKKLGDINLIDVVDGMPQGKALDLSQSSAVEGFTSKISGTNDFSQMKNSDVIIITAGLPRQPGMSRDDLLETNGKIIKKIALDIKKYSPKAFVICITNPLDAMVYVLQKHSKLPKNMCVGMAGVLDSSRMKYFLSDALNVSINDVETFVLGGHGDDMVPLVNYTTIGGIPLMEYIKMKKIPISKIQKIVDRTRMGGGEIVKLLKRGSAFYAPASSAIQMAEAFLQNQKKLLPCAAFINGQYGLKNMYMGVPTLIGSKGVEKIIEVKLSASEKSMLKKSVKSVQGLVTAVDKLL